LGYTHYWYKIPKLDTESWKSFIQDFDKITPYFVADLDVSSDQKLESTGKILYFNGIGENAHETFFFEKVQSGDRHQYHDIDTEKVFSFCKTAQKPYDLAVCSALIIAKKYFGDDIILSSDGEESDWKEAVDLCQNELGYGLEFDINTGGFNLRVEN
jgi:hypothetical protein